MNARTRFGIALAGFIGAGAVYAAGWRSASVATAAASTDEHASHDAATSQPTLSAAQQATGIPAGAGGVAARLASSPRHGEWVKIPFGGADTIMAWVVYPERRENAPVVVAIHENTGLTTWARGVADQLAADGFIGIAPDLLSIVRGSATSDTLPADQGRALIARVTPEQRAAMITAVGRFGMSLPSARRMFGVVGFCWGGGASFEQAVASPEGLRAAVVYYGSAPSAQRMRSITAPVLGLYGGSDQRINAGIPRADSAMKALGKRYEYQIFDGAGHGFLRGQESSEANSAAARRAWPRTIAFFRQNFGS
jgi:carboxymethylenebutenolidase